MSVVVRGRIVRGENAERAEPILLDGASEAQRVRLSQEEVTAHQSADRLVYRALTQARAIVDAATEQARRAAKEAAVAAAEGEQARLAAAWLALRHQEEQRSARDIDRAVAMAQLLAERLLGHAVTVDPQVIASLAREALAEARGARSARIDAHPEDSESLRAVLAETGPAELGGPDGVAIEVVADETLARGSLRVHTDLGTLDARLTPRLERLAAALRDALRPA